MTTTVLLDRVNHLSVQWFTYPGGPLSNVTGVTVEIKSLTTGTTVLGPTSAGVLHVTTGIDRFVWLPTALPLGDYVVIWRGTDAETQAVEAAETVLLLSGTNTDSGLCLGDWTPTWGECILSPAAMAVTGTAVEAAASVLWSLTARQFGLCAVTVRPCRRECYSATWWQGNNWLPFTQTMTPRAGAYWLGMSCGGCGSDCSCTTVSETVLPGPVHEIVDVKIDGVPLTKSVDYRLDNNRLLVRLGAEWPTCNNLNLADTEPGTWSVTFMQGVPVPVLGKLALGALATQFAKAIACDNDCALPQPVQSIARQGVNVTFVDPNEMFAAGRIGLYLPDLFVQTYNPDGRRQRATVYNIDAMSTGRRLGSG